MLSDERLGIRAQDYGDFLKDQVRKNQLSVFFDDLAYAKLQNAPYINRLFIYGSGGGFFVYGYNRGIVSGDGAFGVRFEKAAKSGKKK